MTMLLEFLESHRARHLFRLSHLKSKFEINMTQGQYFKEIDYTNYLLSESYDQGKGYIVLVLFSRVLLEYSPCLQTCVIIH